MVSLNNTGIKDKYTSPVKVQNSLQSEKSFSALRKLTKFLVLFSSKTRRYFNYVFFYQLIL